VSLPFDTTFDSSPWPIITLLPRFGISRSKRAFIRSTALSLASHAQVILLLNPFVETESSPPKSTFLNSGQNWGIIPYIFFEVCFLVYVYLRVPG
jgi:hypothetical protein